MKFSIKDFFSKCDQICSFLWISSYLLKKSLMENFVFCAVPLETFWSVFKICLSRNAIFLCVKYEFDIQMLKIKKRYRIYQQSGVTMEDVLACHVNMSVRDFN